jgi:hypothetical protein
VTATVDEADQAREDLKAAEELLEDLKERVRDGDDAVTPVDVAKAQEVFSQLRDFAELRAEAAQRRMSRAAEERRQKVGRQLRLEVDELDDADQRLRLLVDQAAKAIHELEVAASGRFEVVQGLLYRTRDMDDDVEEFGIEAGGETVTSPFAVRTPVRSIRQLPAIHFVRLALHEGVTAKTLRSLKPDLLVPPTHAAAELSAAGSSTAQEATHG